MFIFLKSKKQVIAFRASIKIQRLFWKYVAPCSWPLFLRGEGLLGVSPPGHASPWLALRPRVSPAPRVLLVGLGWEGTLQWGWGMECGGEHTSTPGVP